MNLWTLVAVLALMASLCAGAAILVAAQAGIDPFLVVNAAMFAVMAIYVARRATRPVVLLPTCRRCGGVSDLSFGFCVRCGHIPRALRPEASRRAAAPGGGPPDRPGQTS